MRNTGHACSNAAQQTYEAEEHHLQNLPLPICCDTESWWQVE